MLFSPSFVYLTLILIPSPKEAKSENRHHLIALMLGYIDLLSSSKNIGSIFWPQDYIPHFLCFLIFPKANTDPDL